MQASYEEMPIMNEVMVCTINSSDIPLVVHNYYIAKEVSKIDHGNDEVILIMHSYSYIRSKSQSRVVSVTRPFLLWGGTH